MAIYDATTKDNKCIFCEIVSGNIKTAGKFWERLRVWEKDSAKFSFRILS